MSPVLPLSLFASTHWWATALKAREVKLFTGTPRTGHYNRYRIATANGLQTLSVPLQGGRRQLRPLAGLHIDYTHDWQRQHWGALFSAYGRAPFFEHLAPGLNGLIYAGHERLEALNRAALEWVCTELRLPLSFMETQDGELSAPAPELPPYHQVFEARLGFQPGLSVLDLMMNEGPAAAGILGG
jgi:hypothetical protein